MSSPLSGFTAVPNPQMLSFMPIQSYLMMYFAGAGWQIGKRKISAIPNDKFNNMSANDLLKGFTADLRETIPTLESSLQDVTPLVRILIEQYGDFIKEILKVTPVVSKDVLFGDQGIFSPTEVGNKALIDDIMNFLRKQFPSLPEASATSTINVPESLKEVDIFTPEITKPFQGPEINPVTGEQSTFLTAFQKAQKLEGAAHIPTKVMSNVSLQSLTIERSRLQQSIRDKAITLKNANAKLNLTKTWPAATKKKKSHLIISWGQAIGVASGALQRAQQKFADFMKRHGHRF